MRAAAFNGPGVPLSVVDYPDPVPKRGEVVVRVGGCGICGTDLHRTSGSSRGTWPLGRNSGHEFAGEVVAVGEGVERLALGDRIAALPVRGCGGCSACLQGQPMWCTGERPAR